MHEDYRPPERVSEREWKQARRTVLYEKVVCAITGCSVDLSGFEDVREQLHLSGKRELGLQEIPIERIRGSVGRFDDFTSSFLPRKDHMRERWENVDESAMQGKAPPIEVYQVDDAYFVVDGNHRVSVARLHGRETIEANVTEFVSPFDSEHEADIDRLLIEAEQAAFLERFGDRSGEVGAEIGFTCAGCYPDLGKQIETYRRGLEKAEGGTVSFDRAYEAWKEEVYDSAAEAIRQNGLVSLFPERTEADLFIWAWQNRSGLEAEEVRELGQEISGEIEP